MNLFVERSLLHCATPQQAIRIVEPAGKSSQASSVLQGQGESSGNGFRCRRVTASRRLIGASRADGIGQDEAKHPLFVLASRGGGFRRITAARAAERGYTLIEVIVAFAVLALGLTLLLGTLTGATRQVRWSEEAGRAALHAQSLLDDTGVGVALQPGQRDGKFENGHYRWSLTVVPYRDPLLPPAQPMQDLGAPRLLQLTLTVQWGNDDNDPRRRLQVQSLRLVTPDSPDLGVLP